MLIKSSNLEYTLISTSTLIGTSFGRHWDFNHLKLFYRHGLKNLLTLQWPFPRGVLSSYDKTVCVNFTGRIHIPPKMISKYPRKITGAHVLPIMLLVFRLPLFVITNTNHDSFYSDTFYLDSNYKYFILSLLVSWRVN